MPGGSNCGRRNKYCLEGKRNLSRDKGTLKTNKLLFEDLTRFKKLARTKRKAKIIRNHKKTRKNKKSLAIVLLRNQRVSITPRKSLLNQIGFQMKKMLTLKKVKILLRKK